MPRPGGHGSNDGLLGGRDCANGNSVNVHVSALGSEPVAGKCREISGRDCANGNAVNGHVSALGSEPVAGKCREISDAALRSSSLAGPVLQLDQRIGSLSFADLLNALAEKHEQDVNDALVRSGLLPPLSTEGDSISGQASVLLNGDMLAPEESLVGPIRRKSSIASQPSTSLDSAHKFVLNEYWATQAPSSVDKALSILTPSGLFDRKSTRADLLSRSSSRELTIGADSRFGRFVIHPASLKRLLWDFLSFLALAFDVVSMPFTVAFVPEVSPFMEVANLITLVFWTLDMPITLITGFESGKRVVLDMCKIAMRFCKTWLVMDVTLCTFDWVHYAYGSSEIRATGIGRSLRSLRMVRTLRLMRILKLKRIWYSIQDHINTETLAITVGIVKIISVLLLANHLVACLWFALGNRVTNEMTWVKASKMADHDIRYKYATSLHWSLTQFTPASMEVVPQNFYERSFSVVILIFAMVCFSSFVSSLTASISEIRKISNDGSHQFWLLRRYMRDWNVSKTTRSRIQRYLEYAYARQRQRVQESEVRLLSLLSEPLREMLQTESFAAHINEHPLFYTFGQKKLMFSKAIVMKPYASRDTVFNMGQQAKNMIFVADGQLKYDHQQGHGSSSVSGDMWAGEAALWTSWVFVGSMKAAEESQVLLLDVKGFGKAVSEDRPLFYGVTAYARAFLVELNTLEESDITDLLQLQFSSQKILDTLANRIDLVRNKVRLPDGPEDFVDYFRDVLKRIAHTFRPPCWKVSAP